MDVVELDYRERHRRVTRETFPVPRALLPASGPSPARVLPARMDLWLRSHPPPNPFLVAVALAVLVVAVAEAW